ncbi:MAG: hypothetical protein ABL962_20850 [Fimbriimonadaceae bacterium]
MNFIAFILATAAAYSLSFGADLLLGRLWGLYDDTVWIPIAGWSVLCGAAVFGASLVARRTWVTWAPFGIIGVVVMFAAVVGPHPHNYLVAAAVFAVAYALYRSQRPQTMHRPDSLQDSMPSVANYSVGSESVGQNMVRLIFTYTLTLALGSVIALALSWVAGLLSVRFRFPVFVIFMAWWIWSGWKHASRH